MNDDDYQPPALRPLPHPELFEVEPEAPEPAVARPAAAQEPAAARPAAQEPRASGRPTWRGPLFAFGAVALYALLIDAAVEAVLDTSPIRWVVVGVVGAFLALNVLLWRRTGWPMKAGLAVLVLLGLLAGAAWYAGDVQGGLRLVRLPPLVVVTAVTGFVVALGGFSLMQLRVPWWDRLLIGGVAAYGVAAFVVPLVTGSGYPALLSGGGFWQGFPFWLQGGFVGVLVLLPASLVALFFTSLRRIRGKRGRAWAFQVVAVGLGLLLALVSFSEILPSIPSLLP